MSASKLTDGVRRVIVETIRKGGYLETAACQAGVAATTLREWLRRGEGRDARETTEELEAFAVEYRKAEADAELDALADIEAAGKAGSWQARAWFLERRKPEKYSTRVRETVAAEIDALYELLEAKLDAETYSKILHVIAESKGANAG